MVAAVADAIDRAIAPATVKAVVEHAVTAASSAPKIPQELTDASPPTLIKEVYVSAYFG